MLSNCFRAIALVSTSLQSLETLLKSASMSKDYKWRLQSGRPGRTRRAHALEGYLGSQQRASGARLSLHLGSCPPPVSQHKTAQNGRVTITVDFGTASGGGFCSFKRPVFNGYRGLLEQGFRHSTSGLLQSLPPGPEDCNSPLLSETWHQ
jgi:hypothetical protein